MSASNWPNRDTPHLLYHYTSESSATRILEDELPYAVAGQVSHFGFGLYATDIEPSDAEALEYVNTECFRGERITPELDHVLVLLREGGRAHFEQVAPSEWMIECSSPEAIISLEALAVAALRWNGSEWLEVATWDGWEWDRANAGRGWPYDIRL